MYVSIYEVILIKKWKLYSWRVLFFLISSDWVVLLGPDTYGPDGKYQYSVVTDDASVTLFVLARNTTEFMRKYNTQVQERLSEFGFKHFYNKPLETYQKSDCEYISITEKQID